jgi:transcription elongation factor GreA
MTATLPRNSRHDVLLARLDELRTERLQTLSELTAPSSGDDADRATNVDGHVRLAMLDRRILALEEELSSDDDGTAVADGKIHSGDVVTLDFGDGPEPYVFGSVEQATDGVDVITPGSPLGQALTGAQIGSTISYATSPRRTLQVTIVAVS